MQLLGIDIGSSSVKAAIIDGATGRCLAAGQYPDVEMTIEAPQAGWAEQHPDMWYNNFKQALARLMKNPEVKADQIGAIGISYQMHGLVLVDKAMNPLRNAIIWCDSRATGIGAQAFKGLGEEWCLSHLLNSPGNFTASKLKWVIDNQKAIYEKAAHFMLPGDYIAMKLTGEVNTTVSGLSEGIFWDFKNDKLSSELLAQYGIDAAKTPQIVPTFGDQGKLSAAAAAELGLKAGIPVTYRAGDQPNNAFSLNVLNPGEVAATAGTSGVVYAISDQVSYDPHSRVNAFAHVNHTAAAKRLGVLLCINGTGIQYSWMKREVGKNQYSYPELNEKAAMVPPGSEGVRVFPFGNGAERVLKNQNPGARISGINFNQHHDGHLFRAAQEGIAFSFKYGMEVMNGMGISTSLIRAGSANLFLSPLFRKTLASITGATIELYNTDGAIGAARGAGVGANYYKNFSEAFVGFEKTMEAEPVPQMTSQLGEVYESWKSELENMI
ncbi:xylulokinase [Breznakibacter xylanolyticus]|uniref:Xylulokinase n=1 Tax=Breznakibacter xylanolyticus TaxID=990 RepID=A0A2W7P3T9_9BACT|nr:FGGY family carbohydrate kinase [Breznakibacter xylanolyticus]PZX20076.1 xylulokinase [Breznakibacter xylanolyticus]